jgi:hypothetical protein
MKTAFFCIVMSLAPLAAQEIKVPPAFENLAAKAQETVNVTLDSSILRSMGKMLSSKDPAQQAVAGLKGIYVRSYKFAKEGEYSSADVEAIRSQIRGPGWTSLVTVRKQGEREDADVAIKREGDRVVGLVVLAAEPRELTFVSIEGPINLEQLSELGGQFGVPKVEVTPKPGTKK